MASREDDDDENDGEPRAMSLVEEIFDERTHARSHWASTILKHQAQYPHSSVQLLLLHLRRTRHLASSIFIITL
jgi:hypothetical protein